MIDRIKHHGTSVIIELSKTKENGDIPTITIGDTSNSHKVISLGHGATGTSALVDLDGLHALDQVLTCHLSGGDFSTLDNYRRRMCWYCGIHDEINVVVLVPRSHYSLVAIESDMFGDNCFVTHWVPNNHLHKPKATPPSSVDVIHHITENCLDLTGDPNYTAVGTDEYNIIRHTPSGTKYRILVERVR